MATISKRTAKDGATSYGVEIRLKGYPPQRAAFARLTDARLLAKETQTERIVLHDTKNGERRVVPLAGPALALQYCDGAGVRIGGPGTAPNLDQAD